MTRGRSPTDELREEHDVALAGMTRLRELAAALLGGGQAAPEGAGDELSAMLADFGRTLQLHFQKEEEGLFPEVRQMISEGAPPVDILSEFFGEEAEDDLVAHHLLRGRLRELREVVKGIAEAGQADEEASGRLRRSIESTHDLLERHVEKESKLVFPMIERLLDAKQVAAVRERFAAIAGSTWARPGPDEDNAGAEAASGGREG
jgi:hemerythrin-like domain-containing protein